MRRPFSPKEPSPQAHAHDHADDHDHDHDHGGPGHSHAPTVTSSNERRLRFVLILTASYALVQAVGGWLSGSLALIADSGHMISDAGALALALVAYRMARRAADARASYGYHRARVLAALVNGAALILLIIWIGYEALMRLRAPVEVLAGPMLLVAAIGLLVNIIGAVILMRGERGDQNLKGAYLHVLGDLLGSVGAIGAALGIMATGYLWLDPLLSIGVALLVLRSALSLVREAGAVLMQTTPAGLAPDAVLEDLRALPQVAGAAHFHAWTLSDQSIVATLHVAPAPGIEPLDLPAILRAHLQSRFGVTHATIEVNRLAEIDAAGADH